MFEAPSFLLLALPGLYFIRRSPLAVLALALCSAALAKPYFLETEIETTSTVLLDTSKSIPEDARSFYLSEIKKLKDADVLQFDQSVKQENEISFSGQGTNLELALASIPRGQSVILFTDGQENQGQASRLLHELEAPVQVVTGQKRWYEKQTIEILELEAPVVANAGEQVEVFLSVSNPSEAREYILQVLVEDEVLTQEQRRIPKSFVNRTLTSPLRQGLQKVEVRILDADDSELIDSRYTWVNVFSDQGVLLLSGDSESERALKSALSQLGYKPKTVRAPDTTTVDLKQENAQLVILNNVSKSQLSQKLLDQVREFVETGGSLLLVGGKRSFGLGKLKGTVIEQLSPVKFLPPQTTPKRVTTAIALLIDKSRSMSSNQKLESAKAAALESIMATNDRDYIGVIAFDQNPYVLIEIERAGRIKGIARGRLRDYLTAAGGTNLLPSLAKARRELGKIKAGRKHIIVLSDGDVRNAGAAYFREIDKLAAEEISVSTVAIGRRAAAPFMQSLASAGGGTFYHTADPRTLPRIFLKDIKFATGEKTVTEGLSFPITVRSRVFDAAYPDLTGLVKTEVKDRSYVLLESVQDPVLASRELGEGRVSAFTSDLSGRWSSAWLKWRGFGLFVKRLVEFHTSDSSGPGELDFDINFQTEGDSLLLELYAYNKELDPLIKGEVKSPRGDAAAVELKETAPGRFVTRVENILGGDYFFDFNGIPEFAVSVSPSSLVEQSGLGLNSSLLQKIASKTGGEVVESVDDLTSRTKESTSKVYLSLYFLGASSVFYLLSLFFIGYRTK